MAATPKVLARTAATTTSSTLYTVPNTTTTTIVSNVVVTNTATSAGTFTLNLDTIPVASAVSVPANSTTFIDLKQVLPANNPAKTITGLASATSIYFHISGVELV